jgi:hypothetical protein
MTCVLILPLFKLDYLDNWPSIEGTFVGDARILRDHLPHPGWQPLWYCGTRFDYIYPPLIRYGPALVSKYFRVSVARAHHIYTGILYAFGIVAVYWLVRSGSGSRGGGILAAIAVALLSPSFLLIPEIRLDSGFWVPQRLHSLMAYGEGPHISAVCILPAALAAAYQALRKWRPGWFALAAALCALLVSHNFYGATGLAIFFPIVAWAVWTAECDFMVWVRAAGVAVLAWGLCAVWLTPSYVKITLIDLKWVAQPGNQWSRIVAAIVIWAFCEISYRFAARRPERTWTVFVLGCGVVLSMWVIGFFHLGFRVAGEHGRLVPELDLALVLVFVEVLRRMWRRPRLRILAAALTLAMFIPAVVYLQHAYSPFPAAGPLENQYEYKITKWISEKLPGERVFAVGTIRFWYNAWFDVAEPDGGSLQGMLNQVLPLAYWQITAEDSPALAKMWLQSLGADAVIVPDQTSPEHFHDMQYPAKFRDSFPALFDDRQGTVIYRVPRSARGIGRVVDPIKLAAARPVTADDAEDTLAQYTAVVEAPQPRPVEIAWHGFEEFAVRASTVTGEAILVQETYDPAWHAYENGRRLAIRPEPVMNFMLLDVSEGSHNIRVRFETPLENRIGFAATALSGLMVASLLFWRRAS